MHLRIVNCWRPTAIAAACGLLLLSGCGGGDTDDESRAVTTHILSDPRFDGDIERIAPDTYTVTQGMSTTVQSVLAGIDPVGGTEFRAFLDFPLGGSGGVPGDAIIEEAFLELYVTNLDPITARLPLRIDLVSFQPPTLVGTDYSRSVQAALASVTVSPDISRSDVGNYVPIDVTPLMREAQRRGLADFQVRIMEDLGPPIPALMIIDDPTGSDRESRAPLLTVTYF
jgi:hypothetical protein